MRSWHVAVLLVLVVSILASFWAIENEPYNRDEAMWLYIAQKNWEMFRSGDWDSREWENIEATWGYPNPPVAKYLMGIAMQVRGAEWEWGAARHGPWRSRAAT